MIIRNDDPAYDTDLNNYKTFCEIVDKYNLPIIQAIVPIGSVQHIDSSWSNEKIIAESGGHLLTDNDDLWEYMLSRNDIIGVHGLWHTHVPTMSQIGAGKVLLEAWGFKPKYFVTPFNEGDYPDFIGTPYEYRLEVSAKTDCLETFLNPKRGVPKTEIVYLHSWRFGPGKLYSYDSLDRLLHRLTYEK